ncbi:MAG: hypothetical protein JWQ78_1252 [Sediminibacterium sp.]|nr:hypothetical protein [Sediminibacterium sp.]
MLWITGGNALFGCDFSPNYTRKPFIMAPAGYAGTPLVKKLGLTPEMKLVLVNAPADYAVLVGFDPGKQVIKTGVPDFVHIFAVSRGALEKQFHSIIKKASPATVIWISWYKKSAKIPTDITEDTIRGIVLPTGWVDVKVCAVSEAWSGLKVVLRKENRT